MSNLTNWKQINAAKCVGKTFLSLDNWLTKKWVARSIFLLRFKSNWYYKLKILYSEWKSAPISKQTNFVRQPSCSYILLALNVKLSLNYKLYFQETLSEPSISFWPQMVWNRPSFLPNHTEKPLCIQSKIGKSRRQNRNSHIL